MKTSTAIAKVCDEIKALLLEKNAKYGDSALNPKRIFSSSGSTEQILVRIDDKLSRIATTKQMGGPDEDTLSDLIGYLVLLKVAARTKVEPRVITGRDPGDEHVNAVC
jgi:hypothetical protein|tara:strand:+ start:243 stop:566 length:324 start_codon:yes stop_codon:yes gene_type:complete